MTYENCKRVLALVERRLDERRRLAGIGPQDETNAALCLIQLELQDRITDYEVKYAVIETQLIINAAYKE